MPRTNKKVYGKVVGMIDSNCGSGSLSAIVILVVCAGITWFAMGVGMLDPLTEIIHNIIIDLAREFGDLGTLIAVAGQDGWEMAETLAGFATFFVTMSIAEVIMGRDV